MDHELDRSIWHTKAVDDIPNFFRRFNIDSHRGNYELFCREFSYSTIFGNLRTANIQTILEMLGISRLPNIMFLIHLDNCHKAYATYPEFSANPYRTGVVQALQARLKKLKIESVVSRFLGHWSIGAFLVIDRCTMTDEESKQYAASVAADLVKYVGEKSGESISIGVSDFCASHAQFPRAYSECQSALSSIYYGGKQSVEVYDKRKLQPGPAKSDMTRVSFTNMVSLLDKCDTASGCDTAAFFELACDMVEKFRRANIDPAAVRMLISRLFGRLTDYYTAAGLDHAELSQISQDSFMRLLECGFACEVADVVTDFCVKIGKMLSVSRLRPNERFRRHVNDCIERHCSDSLFDLNAIATLSNYSPSYFSRLFTRTYGIPFSKYLAAFRVERAKKLLLQESLTLQEIAGKAGFCSTSYFCSVFKKKTGKSPRQYTAGVLSVNPEPAPKADLITVK